MKTRSCKAKGLKLQKDIAEIVAKRYDLLIQPLSKKSEGKPLYCEANQQPDLVVKSMGLSGADVISVSDKAKKVFPFSIEAKNVKSTIDLCSFMSFKDALLCKWWEQAESNASGLIPLLIFKTNGSEIICSFPIKNDRDHEFLQLNINRYCIACYDGRLVAIVQFEDFLDLIDELRGKSGNS